jgi:hypothetical protein
LSSGNRNLIGNSFRQGMQLAEGPKSAKVKYFFIAPAPSARQLELAEGVEFREKNAGFSPFRLPFGGGGPLDWELR